MQVDGKSREEGPGLAPAHLQGGRQEAFKAQKEEGRFVGFKRLSSLKTVRLKNPVTFRPEDNPPAGKSMGGENVLFAQYKFVRPLFVFQGLVQLFCICVTGLE